MKLFITIGLILAIGAYIIFLLYWINKKKSENDVRNVLDVMSEKKETVTLFFFEQKLVNLFNVNENQMKVFIYSERAIIVALFILTYIIFGMIGIGLFACVVILILMENKLKQEIYESGITRINDTVAFMDYFVPSINSGNSAYQAFLGYINKLDEDSPIRKLLIDYRNNKTSNNLQYVTPESIKTITNIYENAVYNEEKGVENYLYIIEEAKRDLFQKQQYYTDYNTRMSEVIKPISWAYYIGVPLCIFLTAGSVGDFWFSLPGLIATIVLVIFFFLFKYLLMKLNLNTVRKIL